VEYRTASRKVYNKFCAAHPNISISFEKWEEIIYAFNYNFRDHILETGDKCKLPWGMGAFTVSKKKSKRSIVIDGKEHIILAVDWEKTHRLGKRVYLLNNHTDGYRFKWYWFPYDSRFSNVEMWVWKPSRFTSRKLAEYLKRPNSPYPELYKEWERKRK